MMRLGSIIRKWGVVDMEFLRDVVQSKTATLVGSAPGANLDGHQSDLLVCVNGAALGLEKEVVPDITIFNTAFATLGNLDYGMRTRARLHELRTKLLIILDLGNTTENLDALFSPINSNTTRKITLDERCDFLERFIGKPLTGRSGPDHVPSTGFFSCLYLLASGAQRVSIRGISFSNGHSYLNSVQPRAHTERDMEAMDLILKRNYPVDFENNLKQQFTNLHRRPVLRPSLLKYC
jgi:hypothetical protein